MSTTTTLLHGGCHDYIASSNYSETFGIRICSRESVSTASGLWMRRSGWACVWVELRSSGGSWIGVLGRLR